MLSRRDVLLSAASAPLFAYASPVLGQGRASGVVETASGRVRGQVDKGVVAFRGIPYAATTAGDARYHMPGKSPSWTGIRDCFDYGPTAPQSRGATERSSFSFLYSTDVPQGEDCLVLNVWTPAADAARRPVMVWLHGGGFVSGSGSGPLAEGSYLAGSEDVVVVSLNHRLGVLGYLDLAALDPDFDGSVNIGMLDIVAALTWVRDNIAAFGGDPSRVMIFGESGGSLKVATLLAMPSAAGLFHRAAMESGAYVQANTRELGARVAATVFAELGVGKGEVRKLLDTPLPTLLAVAGQASRKLAAQGVSGPGGFFASTMDGTVVPRHPFDPGPSPVSANVPLLIGSNRTETTLINAIDRQGFDLDPDGLDLRVKTMFPLGDDARRILASYRRSHADASPSELYYLIGTDQWLTTASRKIAERKSQAGGAPAFLYRFDWRTPVEGGIWRAPHTIEIPYVFRTAQDPRLAPLVGPDPDLALAGRVSGAWAAFARTGSPNGAGLPRWPAYSTRDRATMIYNSATRVERDPDSDKRALLDPIIFKTPGGRGDKALTVRSLLGTK